MMEAEAPQPRMPPPPPSLAPPLRSRSFAPTLTPTPLSSLCSRCLCL